MSTAGYLSRAWALLLAFSVSACLAGGQRGKLAFGYRSSDSLFTPSAGAPLLTGAEASVVVLAPKNPEARPSATILGESVWVEGAVSEVLVERAVSSDPGVLEVVGVEGAHVHVRANKAGKVELQVTTRSSSDSIRLEVVDLHHVELQHSAWIEDTVRPGQSVLLRGGRLSIRVDRRSADGRWLFGHALSRDVEVLPETAVKTLNTKHDSDLLHIELTGGERVSFTPARGTALTLDVVSPDQVTKLDLEADEDLFVAIKGFFLVHVLARVRDGRYALALGGLVTVQSRTPQVCEVHDAFATVGDGYFFVTPLKRGECTIAARLGSHRAETNVEIPRLEKEEENSAE